VVVDPQNEIVRLNSKIKEDLDKETQCSCESAQTTSVLPVSLLMHLTSSITIGLPIHVFGTARLALGPRRLENV